MVRVKKADTKAADNKSPVVTSVTDWLDKQAVQDQLRFITCGSVDDGKSTLIGRLLWDTHQIFDDQIKSLETDSRLFGTQGRQIDLALLVDGLTAEREQGITIDVAYRYFATPKRKFIVADTPGHTQYTRNMITGASTANLAILLVDAQYGLQTQTRRHAYLTSLIGVKHVVVAVNKMDLVNYDEGVFNFIFKNFKEFSEPLNFDSVTAIPVSALLGDNITVSSKKMPWYSGPTLLNYLETVDVAEKAENPFVFPVQWVNRPDSTFRGFSGTIASGTVKVGDTIRVSASGETARVDRIVTFDGNPTDSKAGDAITLVLDREIDSSRGDVITASSAPLEATDQFEANLVWMHSEKGLTGRSYDLKLANQWTTASLTKIKYRINVDTLAHEPCMELGLNNIATCNVTLSKPIALEAYKTSKILGAFILVDRISCSTVAVGLINHNLRRAQNVHRQVLSITRKDRETLNGHKGKIIWFTGLSGSGKSTLANALEKELHIRGRHTYILDGDNVRLGLNKDLGFTEADRVENIRRVAEVAKLMMDAGLIVITAFISPFRSDREQARQIIGPDHFIEVYVNTSLEVCERRDTKGLYKKARSGQLTNMTGVNHPYEPPADPDIVVSGDDETSTIDAAKDELLKFIMKHEPTIVI